MSQSFSSGSAAMSTAPSASSMYDQKSPYARVRQQRRSRALNPSALSMRSQLEAELYDM
jgi:hypothetical protein